MRTFRPRPRAGTGDCLTTRGSLPRGWYSATHHLARGIPQPHVTSPNLNQNDSVDHSSHSPSKPLPSARLTDYDIVGTVTSVISISLLAPPTSQLIPLQAPSDPSAFDWSAREDCQPNEEPSRTRQLLPKHGTLEVSFVIDKNIKRVLNVMLIKMTNPFRERHHEDKQARKIA
ncbi:hypothetical protein BHE74_00052192 [Ensete ventricosum]|nr:hypothetical protein BHE74_00052192 [Ensete ventricosum]